MAASGGSLGARRLAPFFPVLMCPFKPDLKTQRTRRTQTHKHARTTPRVVLSEPEPSRALGKQTGFDDDDMIIKTILAMQLATIADELASLRSSQPLCEARSLSQQDQFQIAPRPRPPPPKQGGLTRLTRLIASQRGRLGLHAAPWASVVSQQQQRAAGRSSVAARRAPSEKWKHFERTTPNPEFHALLLPNYP